MRMPGYLRFRAAWVERVKQNLSFVSTLEILYIAIVNDPAFWMASTSQHEIHFFSQDDNSIEGLLVGEAALSQVLAIYDVVVVCIIQSSLMNS